MKELSIFVDESGDFGKYSQQFHLSRSEKLIFYSKRDLNKDFLKPIQKLLF
ncbi:MAG: hypothetical protein GX567_18345 [Clostridia bacterium]|nr:hypothetical protein [Clostridia bacterium]HKM23021.1 hypothetical protein [Lachnospiraceae bacterium]